MCSAKSKSKLIASGKQRRHVRSSSRVHFVGLTPSEPSSPANDKPTTTTTTTTTPVSASVDNGQLCHLHHHHHQQHELEEITAVSSSETVRPIQAASTSAVSGTVRRTLYSPRYTSDGRLKHCLTTTTDHYHSSTKQ